MSLDEIRKRIDTIDKQLLDLLSQRADLVHEVGLIKKRDGLQIYAPDREEALLRKLVEMNEGRLPEKSIRSIYREIMSAALALEEDLKIAYLGPEGTWTHQAAIKKFGHSVNYTPHASFSDVFDDVARRRADYGVVPIENSTEGAVSHTLDLFSVHDRPGSLVAALKAFDSFEINMSKIESRPSKQKDWEYIFYVDLAGHCENGQVSSALEELEKHCSLSLLLRPLSDS